VLYVADEDHRALRRVPLPVRAEAPGTSLELPGAPAQVLPLDGGVLVTVRDPSLLMLVGVDTEGRLAEKARVELPDDAWGLAITADEATVIVSSAWSHHVSAIDLGSAKKLWSVDVAREPRGVVVTGDGRTAYVSHLVGGELTRIDGLRETPKAVSVSLPPAPLRSPSGVTLSGALAYAALLSPDEKRLYVARHALGALGEEAWFGASTVDVLLTAGDVPLAPRRHGRLPFLRADRASDGAELIVPGRPLSPFTQPRALAYRNRTRTLLVASEGDDTVVELDALGVDPTRTVLASYQLGRDYDPVLPVASTCGAPTGLALSEDESTAWVWCRSTYDLATLPLADFAADSAPDAGTAHAAPTVLRLADDALDADGTIGRRLFYNATDRVTSGGLACAGCHPEGRDDGHTWHEAKINTKDGTQLNFLGHEANIPAEEGVRGVPRRTPMLAGRVNATGPYGWHGESPDLPSRLDAGFGLHRWGGMPKHEPGNLRARSARLAIFLRQGLVPPPGLRRELDANEARGKELFTSEAVGCALCHVPESEYTDRASYPLPRVSVRPGFDDEEARAFKTPSLRFVGGRAPYFHDGRASSLERLIDDNDDRMGRTKHLSRADRDALIAFLRTL
jgi:cytochrome c peroxidase/DNA-binding beta-propeller fold protein YncE